MEQRQRCEQDNSRSTTPRSIRHSSSSRSNCPGEVGRTARRPPCRESVARRSTRPLAARVSKCIAARALGSRRR
eukprot:3683654-Pyramimonas_sp.AAC.1